MSGLHPLRLLARSAHVLTRSITRMSAGVSYRSYNGGRTVSTTDGNTHVVDMRSDCLTMCTDAMREAMANATMGDDVFNEDPTVHALQDKVADMFGMEAALFVPSGTMGNLIAVLCHCDRRGLEVLLGSMSHLVMYEQGGIAQLGGVMPRSMPNKPDGTYDLDELESFIRPMDDPHQPITGLLTIENTHGNCGGKVIPLDFLAKLREKADIFGLPVHMDGARVMNAAVALNVEPREILQYVDSVSLCLSKGIGAPIGSMIGGTAKLIYQARRMRKALGGGWRQAGPLAAAALVALSDCRERLAQDHKHAKMFAQGVMADHADMIHIDVDGVHTNILMIDILKSGLTAVQFCERLNTVTEGEVYMMKERVTVKSMAFYKYTPRLHFCHNTATEDVEAAIRKFKYVLDETRASK